MSDFDHLMDVNKTRLGLNSRFGRFFDTNNRQVVNYNHDVLIKSIICIFIILYISIGNYFMGYSFLESMINNFSYCKCNSSRLSKDRFFVYEGMQIVSGPCADENIVSGRSYNGTSFVIEDCSFSRNQVFSGDSGVIYVTGSGVLNLTNVMFHECFSTNHGGAVYTLIQVMDAKFICGNTCYSQSFYHFGLFQSSIINSMQYLSMTKCSNTSNGGFSSSFVHGPQSVLNSNFSQNHATTCSSIYVYNGMFFTSRFCSFSNNKATGTASIYLLSQKGILSYVNVIANNSPTEAVFTLSVSANFTLEYSVIDKNENNLFSIESGSYLYVFNCFVSHSFNMIYRETTISSNNSMTFHPTYQIPYFQSHYCFADIDVNTPKPTVPSTPVITPFHTPSRTLIQTNEESPCNTIEPTPLQTTEAAQSKTTTALIVVGSATTVIPIPAIVLYVSKRFFPATISPESESNEDDESKNPE